MINRRIAMVRKIVDFFEKEGKIYSESKEYNVATGRPYHTVRLRRAIGSWNRVLRWCDRYFPERMAAIRMGNMTLQEKLEMAKQSLEETSEEETSEEETSEGGFLNA